MIQFLYVTDLHGNIAKYNAVLDCAKKHNIELIHLGADILPKGSDLLGIQKKFIKNFLKNFYIECRSHNIEILTSFGNDDLFNRKKYFRKYASLLDETPFQKNGFTFNAYNYVLDYPFGLKTACKKDHEKWVCPDPYISIPCDYNESGYYHIIDIQDYFLKKGTIKEDLDKIHVDNKTIMAIHQPPAGLNLDVCANGKRVGSKTVYDWIIREKPLIVLSGHIHESFEMTNEWKAELNGTIIIQPGQTWHKEKVTTVLIEISDDKKISAHLISS